MNIKKERVRRVGDNFGTANDACVEKLGECTIVQRRFARREVREIRTDAGTSELRANLKNVVAGDTLAFAPTASFVGTEIGTSDLLGVAGSTTKIGIYQLTTGSEALRACRE